MAQLREASQGNGRLASPIAALDRVRIRTMLEASQAHGLEMNDIEPFLKAEYDPQEYANAIIEGPKAAQVSAGRRSKPANVGHIDANGADSGISDAVSWLPTSGHVEGDLSVALGRMNLAIDDVDRMVRDQVLDNSAVLLEHTAALMERQPELTILLDSLTSLEEFQRKLVTCVSEPRGLLETQATRMSRLRASSVLIKELQALVRLFRRLDVQMQGLGGSYKGSSSTDDKLRLQRLGEEETEQDNSISQVNITSVDEILDNDDEQTHRGLSRAASTVAQIDALLQNSNDAAQNAPSEGQLKSEKENSLLRLSIVQEMLPLLDEARERISGIMEDLVVRGLRDLSPTMLSISLQTAYNLGQLTDLVRDLVTDLNNVVRDRVRGAFDMQALARELGSREPIGSQPPSYRARRGEQVAAQQKQWNSALWKRLEALIVTEMGAICSKVYTLEKVLSLKSDSVTGVKYIDLTVTLLGDKPSSIFWSTLADAIEGQIRRTSSTFLLQSLEVGYPRLLQLFQDFFAKIATYTGKNSFAQHHQEMQIIHKSLVRFQKAYFVKVQGRFEETVGSWSPRAIPDAKEAGLVARAMLDELDAARSDPFLVQAVGKIVLDWLQRAITRIAELIDTDSSPLNGVGPPELHNAALTNASYILLTELESIANRMPPDMEERARRLIKSLDEVYKKKLVEPLLTDAICQDLSHIIARADFGMNAEEVSGSGSAYMADFSERMWYVREQLLLHYTSMPTITWLLRIAKHALQRFVLHASLLRPLHEAAKLRITADMTELEFSLSQLLSSSRTKSSSYKAPTLADCGDDFKALRAFRTLLFSDVTKIVPEDATQDGLPPIVAIHHILRCSTSVPLPFTTRNWSAAEYTEWLLWRDHTPHWPALSKEASELVKVTLDNWRKSQEPPSNDELSVDARDVTLVSQVEQFLRDK